MPKRLLLTGGAGFAGSHAIRHFLTNTDWEIFVPVSFAHKGMPFRIASAIKDRDADRVHILKSDLSAPIDRYTALQFGEIDYIVNYASESHVDRSIESPVPFIKNNVDVMLNMLEYARIVRPQIFIQISTDEVYGPAPIGYSHREWDTPIPSNPYSASKASQEAIGIAYWRTYGVPVVITNTMNMIGEMQDPEKFVPMTIRNILNNVPVPIHSGRSAMNPQKATSLMIGSRFYLHARNLADACLFLINRTDMVLPSMFSQGADRPDKWHVVGEQEVTNLQMAMLIARILSEETGHDIQGRYEMKDFHSSRPGHDLRYALDGRKIAAFGWTPPIPFEESLRNTIRWTLRNELWSKM